jgi:hypothetical protein
MFIHDLVLKKQQNIIQESSGLGDVYRDVAELNDLGLTLPEIAQRLGMSTQEAEEILAGIQGSANDSDISEAISRAQQAAIAISKKKEGVVEATGDPKFDKMLKGITGKRQVAKQQKADTKQQARDAFGGMFGGGNPADSLGIRKKSVDEGADDIAQAKERLAQLEKQFDSSYEYSDDHSVWKKHNEIRQEMDQLKQIIRKGEQGVAEGYDDDGYGYKSLSTEQVTKLIRSGKWEAMSDIKPGRHLQLRNTRSGKTTTIHIKQGMTEGIDAEELANEVYTEFERIYPNLARRANERTVHAAIMDVLNYGGENDPAALAQDVARAVKRDVQQGVAEESKGLWANIHAKRDRIKHGSDERMRKPGSKGAPTADALRKSALENDEHDIASLQKHFDPSVAYDAASHKPAMMQRKDLKGKTHQLVKQPSGKYKSGPAPDYTPDYDQMIRDVANSSAAPEHKKAAIDALMAKKKGLSESTDGLKPGDNIKITTIKGSTYTGVLSHINDNQSIVLNTMGTGGNPHAPDDMTPRKHVVAIKMSHVATIEPIDTVTETSAQDKLHQQHQTLRKQSGLPHPNYYKELSKTYDLPDQERQAKVAELKKKYNITESDEDRQKYVINVQTGQVVDGPFDSIGEIPLRLMGYDGSHKIVSASELKNTQGMAEAKHFRTTYGWAGGRDEKTGGTHKHPDQTKADKAAKKAEKEKQSRDAFGGMFGGGNPADKLGIRKKDVAEGIYEDIDRYVEALSRAGYELQEEKVRLDPKCWKGKKIGNPKTKVKGGVRVNNCVPK